MRSPLTTARISRGVAAALVALCATAPAAVADHGGTALSGRPDNAKHYVDRNDLTSAANAAAVHGVAQLDRSDMDATFTGSGDVEVYDGYYGDIGWYGATNCQTPSTRAGVCDVYRVRFNLTTMDGLSLSKWRSLGCHEFGHTAGLGHRYYYDDSNDNSCMRIEIWPENYDTHDLNAINATV